MSKITIPFKEYNAMKGSRILLWIVFIILLPFTGFTLLGDFLFPIQNASVINDLLVIASFMFLCVSLLFLRRYRIQFFIAAFYLHAAYFFQDQPLPGDPVWQGPYAIIFVFFLLTAAASLLTAIVLTIHAAGKTKLPFFKWVPVAYAVFLIAYTVILVSFILTNLSPNFPLATPQNIASFITGTMFSALSHLIFAYFGYKAFCKAYCSYFIRQPFSRTIRENNIRFS